MVILDEDAVDSERFMGNSQQGGNPTHIKCPSTDSMGSKEHTCNCQNQITHLHITQSQWVHTEFEFAANIWDRLQKIHQSGSFGDHCDLNCQLWTTKYDPDMESETLQSHINGMMNVTQQLNCLGSQVPEETQMIAILGSLPSDYCIHMTI